MDDLVFMGLVLVTALGLTAGLLAVGGRAARGNSSGPPMSPLRGLRPDRRRLALLGGFAVLTWGALVQAEGFADDRPAAAFASLPLWETWAYAMVPLAVLTRPLAWRGADVLAGPLWLLVAVSGVYAYGVACLLVSAWDRLRRT